MSSFDVLARRVTVEPHPNADAIELARIDDYVSIVRKGDFQTGDLGIYIPEQAIVPQPILEHMGLWDSDKDKGKLAGPEGTRVKAIKLRGVLSQGLLLKVDGVMRANGREGELLEEGRDYAEDLGVTKWAPPIPTGLAGEVVQAPSIFPYTDIENVKKYKMEFERAVTMPSFSTNGVPRFPNGSPVEVVVTEKIHGTCSIFHWVQDLGFFVTSKGLASKGLAIRDSEFNAYWQIAHRLHLEAVAKSLAFDHEAKVVTIFGETFGRVQSLRYGLPQGLDFRAFDVSMDGHWLDYDNFEVAMDDYKIPTVPVLYRGPFTESLYDLANGKETVTGTEAHIREGVVMRPEVEMYDSALGRVIVKVIGEKYLLGDHTEFE